jgi:hypothetical protein
MRRVLLSCLAIAFALACGDDITEPVPTRTTAVSAGPLFATTTTEDGLSISTDKDDYQPGDVVHLTGSGWQPGDVLDVVLTDDPLTHDPHRWTVDVGPDGTFENDTYIVDDGDANVAFTLVATSRATGRSLTVNFTDNITPGSVSVTVDNSGSVTVFPSASISLAIRAKVTSQAGGPTSWKSTGWVLLAVPANTTPSGKLANCVNTTDVTGTPGDGTEATATFNITAPVTPGPYDLWVALSDVDGTGSTACGGGGASTRVRFAGTVTVETPAVVTSTEISSSQNPSGLGQSVTFTASVTTGTTTPVTAGGVTFKEGTCASGTVLSGATPVVLNSSGQAALTTSSLSLGSHVIRACYGGATGFLPSEDDVTQQVNNNATVVEVTSSQNPSVTGQSVTITATVKSGGSAIGAHGEVSFRKGGSDCTDGDEVKSATALNGAGQATYTAAFNASGISYIIRACYGGATGFDAGSGSLSQGVNKASTTTAVVTSKATTVFSEPVSFDVTVSTTGPGSGTPAGKVSLKDGSCTAGSPLAGPSDLDGAGKVSFTSITNIVVGSRTISACYAGNDDFDESDASVTQTVNKGETSTALVSNSNPSVFSQLVTFTATVSRTSPATATPEGSVDFESGGTACGEGTSVLATGATLTGGVATFSVSALSVATHTIRACYSGNTNFKTSEDDFEQTVSKASTTTAISSDVNPSVFSQTVTFTATVGPVGPATAVPTGNVTFEEGGSACGTGTTLLATRPLVTGGASFSSSTLAVGSHTIRACYAETGNFLSSANSVNQGVNQASTATAVTTSVTPSLLNQPVTFGVTVTPVGPAVATPQGNVTLRDGSCTTGTIIGSTTALNGSGQVSFTVSTLAAGTHSVSACYAGNTSFEGSSGSVAQQVRYDFVGLAAPVDRPNMFNLSKAGQAIPLKWQLLDFNRDPVTSLSAVTVKAAAYACAQGSTSDLIEEYASGASGLQNLGGGYYQFNWKTPTSYALSCKTIGLDLAEGFVRTELALFTFKK